jgi:hypothetical protein
VCQKVLIENERNLKGEMMKKGIIETKGGINGERVKERI